MLRYRCLDKFEDQDHVKTPAAIANFDKVAEHYGVPTFDSTEEFHERIIRGEFSWMLGIKGLHPPPSFRAQILLLSLSLQLAFPWPSSTQNFPGCTSVHAESSRRITNESETQQIPPLLIGQLSRELHGTHLVSKNHAITTFTYNSARYNLGKIIDLDDHQSATDIKTRIAFSALINARLFGQDVPSFRINPPFRFGPRCFRID